MRYLKSIFNDRGYTATVDFPSSLYYAELFKMNPDAKVGPPAQQPVPYLAHGPLQVSRVLTTYSYASQLRGRKGEAGALR